MFFSFDILFEIYMYENIISFKKLKNTGFLRYNRGRTYILNNKYEIGFNDPSGMPVQPSEQEIIDIQTFIDNNEDIIRKILEYGEKYIDELK